MRDTLVGSFETTLQTLDGHLVECDGEPDHIHVLLDHSPTHSLSTIAGRLKGASSHAVRKLAYADVRQRLWGRHFWSPSYFVFSCDGAPLETIERYIETQGLPLSRN